MWDKIKSATAIVVITVLIWFTADQQVSEESSFTIPVRIVSTSPSRYAAFADAPFQASFTVNAVGRRRHLKEFADIVASKNVFDAAIDDSKDASPQPQAMTGKEVLGLVHEFGASSVRIRSVDPAAVTVRIDDFQVVPNIRVACDVGDLKVSAEPVPAKVSVKLPRFAAEKLKTDPVARADAEQRIRAARKPDGSFQIKVPVSFDALKDLDPDMKIEVLPSPEVQVSGQIEALTATRRKGPIQITWSVPQQVQDDFKIVLDPTINMRPDVDVTGPKELLDQLDPRDIRAFVDVMAADTEKPHTVIRRIVQFVLPPGFALAAGSPPYEVAFQLEPRATTAASPTQ